MKLTSFTDYGLRVLMLLGLRQGERLTVREISAAYSLSENHVLKIVQTLAKLGYVEPARGRNGGIRLAMDPEDINLGRVIREMEPDFAVVECMDERRREKCVIHSACRLQEILDHALDAFFAELGAYTLADLLKRPRTLKSLLGAGSAAASRSGESSLPSWAERSS